LAIYYTLISASSVAARANSPIYTAVTTPGAIVAFRPASGIFIASGASLFDVLDFNKDAASAMTHCRSFFNALFPTSSRQNLMAAELQPDSRCFSMPVRSLRRLYAIFAIQAHFTSPHAASASPPFASLSRSARDAHFRRRRRRFIALSIGHNYGFSLGHRHYDDKPA